MYYLPIVHEPILTQTDSEATQDPIPTSTLTVAETTHATTNRQNTRGRKPLSEEVEAQRLLDNESTKRDKEQACLSSTTK